MKYILFSTCLFLSIFVSTNVFSSNDWLEDAFDQSHNQEYSVQADARDLFDTQIDAIWSIAEWEVQLNDSIFVRATRFMMQAVVVLAIPMMIFAALKLIFSLWDEAKLKESLKQIWYVAWWVILALMSVMIIFFITALTRSNIGAI